MAGVAAAPAASKKKPGKVPVIIAVGEPAEVAPKLWAIYSAIQVQQGAKVAATAFAGAPAGDVPAWAQAQDAMFADPEAGGSDKKTAPARPKAAPGIANHSLEDLHFELRELRRALSDPTSRLRHADVPVQVFVDIAVTLSSMLSVSHKVPQCMGLLSSHLASTRPAAAVSGGEVDGPRVVDAATVRQLCLLVWAFRATKEVRPFMIQLSRVAHNLVTQPGPATFTLHDIVLLASGYGSSSVHSPELFSAIARRILPIADELNERQLASLCLAFTGASIRSTALHVALADQAERYINATDRASAKHVTNIAWGLVHQGVFHPGFFKALRKVLPGLSPHIHGPGFWQMYTVHFAVRLLATGSNLALPGWFLSRTRQELAQARSARTMVMSELAKSVVMGLEGLGLRPVPDGMVPNITSPTFGLEPEEGAPPPPVDVTFTLDHVTEEGLLVPIAFPAHKVALHVAPMNHYMALIPLQDALGDQGAAAMPTRSQSLTFAARMTIQLLEAIQWQCVVVSYLEWRELTSEQRAALLRSKLVAAGVPLDGATV